jgi:hypothetical protein
VFFTKACAREDDDDDDDGNNDDGGVPVIPEKKFPTMERLVSLLLLLLLLLLQRLGMAGANAVHVDSNRQSARILGNMLVVVLDVVVVVAKRGENLGWCCRR